MWQDCRVRSSLDRLAGRLTVSAWIVLGLCAVALILGSVPGVDVQARSSDCLGQAFAGLGDMHYRSRDHECVPTFVHDHTESAGGFPLWMALGPVVLGALYVRRRPYPGVALACAGIGLVAAAVTVAMTLEIDVFGTKHRVDLWPAQVMSVAIAAIVGALVLALVSMPAVLIARAIRRRAAQPVIAQAVALRQRGGEPPDDAAPGG